MRKEKFLVSLGKELKGKVSSKEIDDILVDYKEYFETGAEEGKTEEELIVEFGSPQTIANELLSDRKPLTSDISDHIYFFVKKRWLQIASIIVFFICLIYCNNSYSLTINNIDIVMAVVLPTLLALSGIHRLFVIKGKLPSKKQTRILIAVSIILMALMAVMIIIYIKALMTHRMIFTTDIFYNTNILRNLLFLFYLLMLAATILILISNSRSFYSTGFLFLLFGEYLSCRDIRNKLFFVTNDNQYMISTSRYFYPLAFGIVSFAAFYLVITLKKHINEVRK